MKPSILINTLEGEEVGGCEAPDPAPPPVEGAEKEEHVGDDQGDVQEDLDRTLQQDYIAHEMNE